MLFAPSERVIEIVTDSLEPLIALSIEFLPETRQREKWNRKSMQFFSHELGAYG